MTGGETPSAGEITALLRGARQGDENAAAKLVPLVYKELRRLANHYFKGERPGHTLQPTAVVHDALLQLLGKQEVDWQNRAHFFAVAAQSMRRILVDYARSHGAEKRGGSYQRVSLEDVFVVSRERLVELLILDQALERLQKWDKRLGRMVELRFFGGMTEEETAEVLGVSVRTVKRDWKVAQAWLHGEMTK
jgi:RNA polymerase sigma-70 factor (ECF subfamily)